MHGWNWTAAQQDTAIEIVAASALWLQTPKMIIKLKAYNFISFAHSTQVNPFIKRDLIRTRTLQFPLQSITIQFT